MKIKSSITLLFCITSLMLGSCDSKETKPVDLAQLRVQIQGMEDAFAAAEKNKNPDAVVAYYSDDAVSYSRNKEPLTGRAAIRKKIADDIATDTSGDYNVYKVIDLYAEGNIAVELGSWTVMNSAGSEKKKGHYFSYFEKRNGKYECVRDMNASSKPE